MRTVKGREYRQEWTERKENKKRAREEKVREKWNERQVWKK